MFKVSMTSLVVLLLLIVFLAQASAQATIATAVSGTAAFGRQKTVPVVQNGTSYEYYELLPDNQTMKRVHVFAPNLHIIIRHLRLYVKIMNVPNTPQGDLSKDKSLGDGQDLVHMNDTETAVLLNHEGVRDSSPRKRKYITWFHSTDLPDTCFFDDLSKVKGGTSRAGNALISVKDGTPEGTGGGQNLFYCEDAPKGFCLKGDVDEDFITIHNAEVKAAPRLLGAEIVTQTTSGDQGESTDPVRAAFVKPHPETKTLEIIALRENVDIKVVRLDGGRFRAGTDVKDDGKCVEYVCSPISETKFFGFGQKISVYANGQLIYSSPMGN